MEIIQLKDIKGKYFKKQKNTLTCVLLYVILNITKEQKTINPTK